jgi:hypothetical protein
VILRALHLNVFDQPGEYYFFNNLLIGLVYKKLPDVSFIAVQTLPAERD